MLEVFDVHSYYGNIHALNGISLSAQQGEIVTLIGGNGAGKTTTLRTIVGLIVPRHGRVIMDGEDLTNKKPHEIVAKGVAMVAYTRRDRSGVQRDLERVFTIFPRLKERRNQVGGTLSGGEQQMLAIGRALMAHPRLMLLDEPSMGLAPLLVESIFGTIKAINREGTTVLLVEQNALMALSIADRGYVVQTGRIVLQDKADKLRENEMVRKAYLGEE
jgi:branched-chain amino acid transport system ATP-binding protein